MRNARKRPSSKKAATQAKKSGNGKPIDAQGTYRSRSGDPILLEGASGMAKFLAESDEVHTAFVDQLFQYAIKQPIRAYGSDTRADLKKRFVENGFNVRKLMTDVAVVSAMAKSK